MFPSHGGWSMMRSNSEMKGRKLQRGAIKRAMSYAAKYKYKVLMFLVTTVAGSALAVVPPMLFRQLIDHALPEKSRSGILSLAELGIGVAVGMALLSLISRWYASTVGEGLIYDLRVSLFDHVQRMPIAFFTRVQTGALISRLNNDVIGAQQAVTGTLGSIVSNLITVVSILAVMIFLSWQLTLLAVAVLPLFLIPSKRFGRRLQGATREQMQLNAQMNTLMTERFNVAGALVAKVFGRPDEERDGFSGRAGRVRDIGIRLALFMRIFFVLLGLVASVGTAVVYLVGGHMVLSGAMTIGGLAAFALYVGQLYSPLSQLANARIDLMTAFVSFERVFEVLDIPSAIVEKPDAIKLVEPRGRIELQNVTFRYQGSEAGLASLEEGLPKQDESALAGPVLKDVSFTVEPGKTVALVGPSGAGKTTMAMLIPRLYDVQSGSVRVDDIDVRDLTLQSLNDAIGLVPQDPHLFHDSIIANLRFAKPDATEDEIIQACRSARIHDLISSLPDGYNTVVGERGYRLSGGEKQRIAIARVLLKNPAIVILDEATSHLDSESEALIQRAFEEALSRRTAVVIAHRLSTVVAADEILVVDGGRIVERGSHSALIASDGLYADLYETQFARTGAGGLEPV
ncbi:MAG: ABC transporter ATP-binding protein [Actinomycetota bacterium]